jgi:hypothetical protein
VLVVRGATVAVFDVFVEQHVVAQLGHQLEVANLIATVIADAFRDYPIPPGGRRCLYGRPEP